MIRISNPLSKIFCSIVFVVSLMGCGGSSSTTTSVTTDARISSGRTLFVSAIAEPGGDGSRAKPFNSLQALELASQEGDDLVVLASPLDAPVLDGGIALKPHQRLLGDGPNVVQQKNNAPVIGSGQLSLLPRIKNTSFTRLNGDAVRLAEASEVRNLVITESVRGAIYGLNVPTAVVHGNDISGYNTTCTIGFTVQPFVIPTVLPFTGAPILLPAGWAGIMIDANAGAGAIEITNNFVHDSACGNGIDVRISGSADYTANVSGNFVTQLKHGPLYQAGFHLVHAITLQVTNHGRLNALSVNNSQTFIGAEGADCEGLFMNLADSATATWTIDRNFYEHGIGGFSCNGLEVVTSNGNARAKTSISNSYFGDNPGDMIQLLNFGSSSTTILEIDNVVVKDTHTRGGDPDINGSPANRGIPGNLGDCLLVGSTGSGNTTQVKVSNSEFSGCNNGFSLLSGIVPLGNVLSALTSGSLLPNLIGPNSSLLSSIVGPDALLQAEIINSVFRDNDSNNFVVGVLKSLDKLSVKVEKSDFSRAGANAVLLRKSLGGNVTQSSIDFGGADLGSSGGNCILGGMKFDIQSEGFQAVMRGNWWGQAGGPTPEKISESSPGMLDVSLPLSKPPSVCST